MPAYFLHLHNAHLDVTDEEGQKLPDLAAARAQALAGIREFLAHEAMKGTLDLRGQIDITDETDVILETILFKDAITIIAP